MWIRVKEVPSSVIPPHELKDGEFAQIVEWATNSHEVGKIVQRCGDRLIMLDGTFSLSRITTAAVYMGPNHKVRILKPGTILEVVE